MSVDKIKPIDSTWTDEQWRAITEQGSHILVAAAAGSGKTAVLIERIIRTCMDETHPIELDRLLVATFTDAAAAEMKHRLRNGLEKAMRLNPQSKHLRRQLLLIGKASITTLHSFCLSVVRKHVQKTKFDPAFRIANETEALLLRQEAIEATMEIGYGESREGNAFWQLTEWFGGQRGDEGLIEIIERLYDYSRSHPFPEEWLQSAAKAYRYKIDPWVEGLQTDLIMELNGMTASLQLALAISQSSAGPEAYAANLSDDLRGVRSLLDALHTGGWEALYRVFSQSDDLFGRLKTQRGDKDKLLVARVQDIRNAVKKRLTEIQEQLFTRTLQEYEQECHMMAPMMEELVRIIHHFAQTYQQLKMARGLVDFNDLEHACLAILLDSSARSDDLVPSAVALEFREHFREVYTDEYQDTNDVQETILRLVSKGDTADDPRAGNRFMVGDVKQSIYRFRLAEPGLFIHKYKTYAADSPKHHLTDSLSSPSVGTRIDLARNFRSRKEVVDTVNLIFRQIMHEQAAEIDYDPQAELIYGAHYAPFNSNHDLAVELLMIDHSTNAAADEDEASFEVSEDQQENEDSVELETAESEARIIAERIRQLIGKTGLPPMEVADKSSRGARPLQYRDIVILLRADKAWAPMFVEQFKQSGIPVYAELAGGYFDALEIRTMLAILQSIDNPLQDIPLATSLTLPMFALTHEQLAQVRLWGGREATFYESLGKAVTDEALLALNNPSLYAKIKNFLITLELWRNFARQHTLADLILTLYRDTGYLDYVGGLPGGTQRQANLRALYDRARQYESTSFRGLFRFLRFIERLRASKADLAPARALGEQEDVVRIMTVHKSKGLEFPVVFVAGLGKKFNRTDERASFLIHKQLGFGPRFVLPDQGVAYPSLPLHAIRRRLRAEAMAEEMRILYVALTRAREKLIMTGSVKSLPKKLVKWQNIAAQPGTRIAASPVRQAENFIDWLLPAFLRTPISATFRHENGLDTMTELPRESATEAQSWKVLIVKPIAATHFDSSPRQITIEEQQWLERLERVPDEWTTQHQAVEKMLGWTDPHALATKLSAKTSVTQWKKRLDEAAGEDLDIRGSAPLKRPRFMEAQGLSPLERGVAYHTVMQHVPLNQPIQVEQMSQFLADLVLRELLTEEQRKAIDEVAVCQFFASEPGLMLMGAVQVMRELPFSVQLPVRLVYGDQWNDTAIDDDLAQEPVLVQGVIDCMFEVGDGLVILDYKTDRIAPDELQEAAERYRHQLAVYKQAVEISLGRPVTYQYLYFFSIAKAIQL